MELRQAFGIAKEEIGGIHQYVAVRFGAYGKTPEHGFGEGIGHGATLGGIGAGGAKRFVALHQQHARTDAFKFHQAAGAFAAAVETDIVRSQAGGDAGSQQEFAIEA